MPISRFASKKDMIDSFLGDAYMVGVYDGMIFRIQARDYIVMPLAKPKVLPSIHVFHVVVFREALQKGTLVVVVVSIAAVVDHVQPLGQGFVREAFD